MPDALTLARALSLCPDRVRLYFTCPECGCIRGGTAHEDDDNSATHHIVALEPGTGGGAHVTINPADLLADPCHCGAVDITVNVLANDE